MTRPLVLLLASVTITFSLWWIPVGITAALLCSICFGSRGGSLGDAIAEQMWVGAVVLILAVMWISIGFGWLVGR